MPDNGFGAIDNSADFQARNYHVTPDWETADAAQARSRCEYVALADPNNVIGFPIVNESTPERLLADEEDGLLRRIYEVDVATGDGLALERSWRVSNRCRGE